MRSRGIDLDDTIRIQTADRRAARLSVSVAILGGDGAGDGGVPHGSLLTDFAEAVLGDDEARLTDIRGRIRDTIGDAAFVDAAAVIANYSALDRVADATGIPLEPTKEVDTVALRAELGIDEFIGAGGRSQS